MEHKFHRTEIKDWIWIYTIVVLWWMLSRKYLIEIIHCSKFRVSCMPSRSDMDEISMGNMQAEGEIDIETETENYRQTVPMQMYSGIITYVYGRKICGQTHKFTTTFMHTSI